MAEVFDKLAGGIGKTIETVPDLYNDALKQVTQESGKTLALIPRAINAALVPLRQWIAEREYKLAETEKLLAQKLEHVGKEKIVTPEAYVAVPALQAISYSMNSEELRNLYANLLAKAMNSDTKNSVHPAFVEIIKQMSPIDVHILEDVFSKTYIQLIDIFSSRYKNVTHDQTIQREKPVERHGFEGITHIIKFPPDIVKISLDNLLRLRLIEERSDIALSIDDEIKVSPYYINSVKQYQKYIVNDFWIYEEIIHIFCLSDLGLCFHDICFNV